MKRVQIKYWLKKDKVRIFLVSLFLAGILSGIRCYLGVGQFFSDLLFTVGAIHIIVGGARYIHNVGLFKTFSYMAYKRRWKRDDHTPEEARPMSLAEYTVNVIWDETRQRPVVYFLGAGIVLWMLSFLTAVIV